MKAYYKLVLVVLAMCGNKVFAQVGMTTNNPHKSAALDLKATKDQGILIPNVNLSSTTDVSVIAGGIPAQSLLVYNTNAGITGTGASGTGYYYWDTNTWKKLSTSGDITAGTASVTSPKATIAVTGTNTVLGATTVDIKPGSNNTIMTTDGTGNVIWGSQIPGAITGNNSVSSPNATISVSGTNTVLGATTVDIKPGGNNTVMTTNGSGVVTWIPNTGMMDTALIAGTGIGITRAASGNTISVTGGSASVTSPNATVNVTGANTVLGATTVDIKPGGNNTVMTTDGSGNVTWKAPSAIGGTASVTSPNATVSVTGTNTVLGATTIDIKPGGNNTVMTTNGSGVVTWVPNNTLDTAMIAGNNVSIVRNAGGNTISATDTAMIAGTGIGITRSASGNTIAVTGGSASVTSPNATVNVTGANTVLGATTVDIKPGGNNTVMTTDGSGNVTWKAPSAIGGTASVTSPNATVSVTGTNTVLGATTIDIKPGGNNTVMTTNGSGAVTWVPNNTLDTAMIAGSNISIVRNAGGNTISATDTAMIAGTGIGITRSASGNTIVVTGGSASVTSPNATVNVTGANTVLGATTVDIKPGGNNTVMTTDGSGNVTWKAPSAIGGTASVTSPNATVNVTGANTVLGATTIDIKPGGNNTVMTTNGSGVVTWVPNNTLDTAMIAGSNISIVRNAGGNTISATDTAMIAGTGIGITRSASGNTIAVTGGNNSVTSPNATINISGTNTVLGATTVDIKAGGNNTVMTTNGLGSVTWAPFSSLGDNLGNHTATQRLNMNNFSVYGADTLIANKARLTALTAGAATDSILTVNTVTGDVRRMSPASFGDNLGNHRATTTLHMANNSIDSIRSANIYYEAAIYDRIAANTNYMSLYKNNGTFGVWNSKRTTNEISIDETSGKTTLTSAAITKGTDGSVPAAGSIATSADASGNIVWKPVSSLGSASVTSPNATVNVTGTNTVLGATTIDIKPGGNNTVMTTNGSGVVTWVPNNTLDTAMIAGSNISIVRNAGGNTISATDTAMIAGTGIGITRSASGNTIAVTGGSASVTSPNATINVSGTNTVLGATTIDINAGGNNTVMTTNGSGSVTWAPVSSLGDNLGNHTATQRLNMSNKSIYGADTLIAKNAQLSNLQSGALTDSIVTVNPSTGDVRKVSAAALVSTVNIKRVTSSYTLTATDNILIVNAAASSTITITVPTAPAGRTYTIKRVDDNVATVNIVFSGGAVVDETDTQISVGNRVSYQIAEEDATHWHTISRF